MNDHDTKQQDNDGTIIPPHISSGSLSCHALRLPPGADLVQSLQEAAKRAMNDASTSSCFILTAVGSLSHVTLRMAAADSQNSITRSWNEKLEIVSLVGTLTFNHKHLHMSISDVGGQVFGGHVMSGTVFTTLELVLGTIGKVSFSRKIDERTGFSELVVSTHTG